MTTTSKDHEPKPYQVQTPNPLQQGNIYNFNQQQQLSKEQIEKILNHDPDVSTTARRVFWRVYHILQYQRKNELWISQQDLTDRLNKATTAKKLSIDQVQKAISVLKESGFILSRRWKRNYCIYSIDQKSISRKIAEENNAIIDLPTNKSIELQSAETLAEEIAETSAEENRVIASPVKESAFTSSSSNSSKKQYVNNNNNNTRYVDIPFSTEREEKSVTVPISKSHSGKEKPNLMIPDFLSDKVKELSEKLNISEEQLIHLGGEYHVSQPLFADCLKHFWYSVFVKEMGINSPERFFRYLLQGGRKDKPVNFSQSIDYFSQIDKRKKKQEEKVETNINKKKVETIKVENPVLYNKIRKEIKNELNYDIDNFFENDTFCPHEFMNGYFRKFLKMYSEWTSKFKEEPVEHIESAIEFSENTEGTLQIDEEAIDKNLEEFDTFWSGFTNPTDTRTDDITLISQTVGEVLGRYNPIKRPVEQVKQNNKVGSLDKEKLKQIRKEVEDKDREKEKENWNRFWFEQELNKARKESRSTKRILIPEEEEEMEVVY